MPESTLQLLQFPNTGLFLMGPKRTVPLTALRRAIGIHDTNTGSLRSRKGETLVQGPLANCHTLGRLNTDRYQAAGGNLYVNGALVLAGLTGTYLSLQKSPPAPGLADYLFVTGGGLSRKITPAQLVQTWGIAPPGQTLAAAAGGGVTTLEGRYWYHSTFMNTTTGNRSNSEPLQAEVLAIALTDISLTGIPVSGDGQVNRREIWRTVADGGAFFLDQVLNDNVTTILTDNYLDNLPLGGSFTTNTLQATELPIDNTLPDDTFSDALIDGLVSFWLSRESGKQGRLYYSPPGRPEGVRGYLTITNDNDACQRIVSWNGRYVFTLRGVYKISGQDPYSRLQVTGVPGVPAQNARTVTPSPYGIFYQAADGLRLFDGARSELIQFDKIGSIFRGETLEYFPAFEGIYAAFARNQLFISDGSRTLCLNYITNVIRELGIGLTALFYEEDTKLLLGALSTGVYILEDESASTFSHFDIETGSLQLSTSKNDVVKRIRIKGQWAGQVISPSLILDDVETALPPFTITDETVEYAVGLPARSVSVRLQATLTEPIVVEQIEVDLYTSRDEAISKIYGYRGLS